MFYEDVLFVLQVSNINLVSTLVLLQRDNFFIKIDELTVLVPTLHFQSAQLTVLADLLLQGCTSVINCSVDSLCNFVNISYLLLQVVRHLVVFTTSFLKACTKLSDALSFHISTVKIVPLTSQVIQAISFSLEVTTDSHEVIQVVLSSPRLAAQQTITCSFITITVCAFETSWRQARRIAALGKTIRRTVRASSRCAVFTV